MDRHTVRKAGAAFAFVTMLGGCSAMQPSDEGTVSKSADVDLQPIPKVAPPHAGKKVAAVAFVNRSISQYAFLGDSAPDFLAEFLREAGFRVVEGTGSQLSAVNKELEYNTSGLVDPATAATLGKQLGTDYVFVGSVTDYEEVKTKGGGGLNLMGYGLGSDSGGITYNIQVSGRLVDIRTREILASKSESYKKTFSVKGGNIDTPWGGANMGQETEVTNQTGGKILQVCLNRLMIDIVNQLK